MKFEYDCMIMSACSPLFIVRARAAGVLVLEGVYVARRRRVARGQAKRPREMHAERPEL